MQGSINPLRIFNVDETGITVVQHKPASVIASKWQKQVHNLSPAERGKLQVSFLFCEAYLRAAKLQTASNGFKESGIHPFNPEHHFAARALGEVEEAENDETDDGIEPTGPPKDISPRDIRDVPIIQASTYAKAGTSFLVTGSPHVTSLTASLEERQRHEERQTKRPE
ncbi:hypothetical protein PR048_030016 [Dryococelus australis]|uniref:Uncharacterized protein n=1 Tax=Dryococelus australis TaxID=614101 RepID=A0ABQ9G883_9NEOP|nr:hypothetical protein PR048_030016 [Dryococelus australis]